MTTWTTRMLARVMELWCTEGLTATVIASKINKEFDMRFSRNAIIGLLRRNGAQRPKWMGEANNGRGLFIHHIQMHYMAMRPSSKIVIPMAVRKSVKFKGLRERGASNQEPRAKFLNRISDPFTCKYVRGDPKREFTYCGHAIAFNARPHSPYCAFHQTTMYQPEDKRRRAA